MPKPRGKHSEVAGFISGKLFKEIERSQRPYLIPKECIVRNLQQSMPNWKHSKSRLTRAMIVLTADEVTQLRTLLIALAGDMLIRLGYKRQIGQCLAILSKHSI